MDKKDEKLFRSAAEHMTDEEISQLITEKRCELNNIYLLKGGFFTTLEDQPDEFLQKLDKFIQEMQCEKEVIDLHVAILKERQSEPHKG